MTVNKKKLPRAIRPTAADPSGAGPTLGQLCQAHRYRRVRQICTTKAEVRGDDGKRNDFA